MKTKYSFSIANCPRKRQIKVTTHRKTGFSLKIPERILERLPEIIPKRTPTKMNGERFLITTHPKIGFNLKTVVLLMPAQKAVLTVRSDGC